MELVPPIIFALIASAFICEFIDSNLGMMYGTILSPVLIISGFGPLVTSGQIISGRSGKKSIGATALAEVPICITAFLAYLFIKGISNWHVVIFLSIGAVSAAPVGAFATSKFKSEKRLKVILGVLTLILGIWTLTKTWLL